MDPTAADASPPPVDPAGRAAPDGASGRTLLAVLVAAGAGVGVTAYAVTHGSLIDLRLFRAVAAAVVHGGSPYHVVAEVPFVYPPAGVLAALPSGLGPTLRSAALLWAVLSLACLARVAWLLATLAWPSSDGTRRRRRACWLFALGCLLQPTVVVLAFGQVGLLLLWLTVEGLAGQPAATRRTWLAGAAAAVKLTPGLVLLGLAAAGRWRSAGWGVVGLVGATAAGALVSPSGVRDYLGGAWRWAADVNASPDVLDHSVPGAVKVLGLPGPLGLALAAALLVAGVALTASAWRHGDELAGLAAVLVTGLLASPVSWVHHWVAAYPALVLLLRELPRRRAGAVVLLAVAVVGQVTQVDGWGLGESRVLGATWLVLVRDWQVLWGLAFLAWAAVPWVRRTPAAPPLA